MLNKFIELVESGLEKLKRRKYVNEVDYQYIKLCKKILKEGTFREGRNGNTYSIFGHQVRFDLSKGLPLLTTKKVLYKPLIHELIWFLKGDTSPKYLIDNNVKIWDLWIKDGDLPFTYPKQWRKYSNTHGEEFDQIADVIKSLKNDPYSRRIIVCAWNPTEVKLAALPWCHTLFQFYVDNGKLSCQLYQRSSDQPLGAVWNWCSYSLLVYVVAQIVGMEPGEFIWSAGDIHIYENQVEALKTQFDRKSHPLAKVKINPDLRNIDDLKFEDIEILDYVSEGFIKIPVSK